MDRWTDARKNNVIDVDDDRVTSVIGDGNAAPAGVAVIPYSLVHRIMHVRTMTDAIHRLAKNGDLRAVRLAPEAARAETPSFALSFARIMISRFVDLAIS